MFRLRSLPQTPVRSGAEELAPLPCAARAAGLQSTKLLVQATDLPARRNKICAAKCSVHSGCLRPPGRKHHRAAYLLQRWPARTHDVLAGTLLRSSTAPLERMRLLQLQPARGTSAET